MGIGRKRERSHLLQSLACLVILTSDTEDGCSVEEHDCPGVAKTVWELVDLGTWEQGNGSMESCGMVCIYQH